MDWRVKGLIQKLLGYVPFGGRLHLEMQRRTGLRGFTRECDIKVDDWRIMMGILRDTHVAIDGATLVEIGTGWYPTLPACFYLSGASLIVTYDLDRLLQPDLVRRLADRLREHTRTIAEAAGLAEQVVEARRARLAAALDRGADLTTATEGTIDYRAPADATRSGLPDDAVDLVFSNSVLEHVHADVLGAMFRETYRILKPGATTLHSVNCGDHYAYFDTTISQLHYLQFSEAEWRLWNNGFQYQNRLRAKEFPRIAREAGLELVLDASVARPHRLAELDRIEVAPMFAGYSREELAKTNIDFVARKPR